MYSGSWLQLLCPILNPCSWQSMPQTTSFSEPWWVLRSNPWKPFPCPVSGVFCFLCVWSMRESLWIFLFFPVLQSHSSQLQRLFCPAPLLKKERVSCSHAQRVPFGTPVSSPSLSLLPSVLLMSSLVYHSFSLETLSCFTATILTWTGIYCTQVSSCLLSMVTQPTEESHLWMGHLFSRVSWHSKIPPDLSCLTPPGFPCRLVWRGTTSRRREGLVSDGMCKGDNVPSDNW